MSSWLDIIKPKSIRSASSSKGNIPEGVWRKCPKCNAALYGPELEKNLEVCPKCSHHMRISARRRIEVFLDPESSIELNANMEPVDRLKFKDTKKYKDRLVTNQKNSGEKDALITFKGEVCEVPVVVAAFEFSFLGGSMGAVVGEKFVRAVKLCLDEQKPLVCFSASGGARMQEALISLMQMAKTAAVLEKLKAESLPYISVLTDPVFGGVSASLAMLGDVNVAEPNALIGFAGPRVIEQTVREKLPEGFQRSEFLLDHGAIDMILNRHDLRDRLSSILKKFMHAKNVHKDIPTLEPLVDEKSMGDEKNKLEEASNVEEKTKGEQESKIEVSLEGKDSLNEAQMSENTQSSSVPESPTQDVSS